MKSAAVILMLVWPGVGLAVERASLSVPGVSSAEAIRMAARDCLDGHFNLIGQSAHQLRCERKDKSAGAVLKQMVAGNIYNSPTVSRDYWADTDGGATRIELTTTEADDPAVRLGRIFARVTPQAPPAPQTTPPPAPSAPPRQ